MVSTGIVQLIQLEEEAQKMTELGYSRYFLTIIGVWKLLGVIAILIPKFPLVKEWTYAGFFFLMTGAVFSHLANGDDAVEYFGPAFLLMLTLVSSGVCSGTGINRYSLLMPAPSISRPNSSWIAKDIFILNTKSGRF